MWNLVDLTFLLLRGVALVDWGLRGVGEGVGEGGGVARRHTAPHAVVRQPDQPVVWHGGAGGAWETHMGEREMETERQGWMKLAHFKVLS